MRAGHRLCYTPSYTSVTNWASERLLLRRELSQRLYSVNSYYAARYAVLLPFQVRGLPNVADPLHDPCVCKTTCPLQPAHLPIVTADCLLAWDPGSHLCLFPARLRRPYNA